MTEPHAKRLLARGWVYVPAVSGPIGGGLIKLCRGSTWAAAAVGLAPYVIWGFLIVMFVIGYFAALLRCLRANADEQDAMERLIAISANAVVSILTLTTMPVPAPTKRAAAQARTPSLGRRVPRNGHGRSLPTAPSEGPLQATTSDAQLPYPPAGQKVIQ
ncbi:MAG TPA: hypothetical protein VHY31_20335 [Streptosporangiaceae bacterium]|jgi:hypothetical protein|nr:hypothetical protein [Streptosporangiaceae bacterium]